MNSQTGKKVISLNFPHFKKWGKGEKFERFSLKRGTFYLLGWLALLGWELGKISLPLR